jgi:hypothetical protein
MAQALAIAKPVVSQDKFYIPARIMAGTGKVEGKRFTDEELAAFLPDDLTAESPFLFPAMVSNSILDAYYTHMSEKTLRNFAAEMGVGVAFLDSHRTGRLPVGYSYNGEFINYRPAQGGEAFGAMGLFYVTRSISLGADHSYSTTNDYIRAIETRVVRDVSVGFHGGKWGCDLCGEDYWAGRCPHVAGMEYEIAAEGLRLATVEIDDAHLSEVSAVYDGATPGAAIHKVEQRWNRGEIGRAEREQIQNRFGIALPEIPFQIAAAGGKDISKRSTDMPKPEDEVVAGVEETPAPDAVPTADQAAPDAEPTVDVAEAEAVYAAVEEARAALPANSREVSRTDVVRTLASKLTAAVQDNTRIQQEADALREQVATLTPLAEDGRAYRVHLIEETLAEGVRVLGEAFPSEVYRNMLETATIDHIQQVRQSFVTKAADRFPGGRQLNGSAGQGDQQPRRAKVPPQAHT